MVTTGVGLNEGPYDASTKCRHARYLSGNSMLLVGLQTSIRIPARARNPRLSVLSTRKHERLNASSLTKPISIPRASRALEHIEQKQDSACLAALALALPLWPCVENLTAPPGMYAAASPTGGPGIRPSSGIRTCGPVTQRRTSVHLKFF